MYTVVLTIFLSLQLKDLKLWLLIPFIVLLVLISLVIKRLINRNPRLIIDEIGIHDKRKQKVYKWGSIRDIEANFNSNSSFKLIIKCKNTIENIDLTNLNTSPKEINESVAFFSDKKIKTGNDKFKIEIERILKNDDSVVEIMMLFSKYKSHILWIGLPIFFGNVALSIYLQILLTFPYVFAIGFLMTGIILFAFLRLSEKRFKEKTEIQNLTEQEYKLISIKYELKLPENKNRAIIGYIAFGVFMIGVFIISYFAST
ncbi:hypothetical protein DET65_3866 [Sunxiuqinia elliptica]|uniref:Uncharacterized protein n=2 Tax=Sunxiuqinia elliptica TaxID=655355 RepID=A0A4R6GVW8_9BACT|nr:hypothetical protein DET52_1072 [Sunxiuqinia elliptica]TDO56316.1 hypothetical protein DET65_3866 [Sunxiuqinia elliptica]